MAIDTADKRASAGAHLAATAYYVPDGSITAPDRLHQSFLYRGIAADSAVATQCIRQPKLVLEPR